MKIAFHLIGEHHIPLRYYAPQLRDLFIDT